MTGKQETIVEQSTTAEDATEQRRQWIERAAYLRAAARDFAGGEPMQDWLDAEQEFESTQKESGR